jgi:hypothetical protein
VAEQAAIASGLIPRLTGRPRCGGSSEVDVGRLLAAPALLFIPGPVWRSSGRP